MIPSARRRRALARSAVVLATALTLAGCSDAGTAPSSSASSPGLSPGATAGGSVSPTPTFTPQPVDGTVDPGETSLDDGGVLGLGATPAVDDGAILATIEQTKGWLDSHLDALQRRGGAGRLGGDPVLGAADEAVTTAVTTALASPDRPVASAHYRIVVYHDPAPRFVEATVTTEGPDDTRARAVLGFRVTGDHGLRAVVLGPGDGGPA